MQRVAAYARVSTDKDDQINSLTNQREYFESYIKTNKDWQYCGVYYDEGVTGTQTKKRSGFNKMIEECKRGNIDLILTKEVSRFARNTVDTLEYTRMLREYGVGVVFINDNIDTRENDGEFRLAIMASVAQEESRKTSERVKWGQRRSMENGVVFGNSIFGFNVNGGVLTVNEKEAEIVRLIYHKYINEGKGTYIIARELYEMGIKPPKSTGDFWSSTMLLKILRNEKYVGDLLQKKTVTTDYLTHKRVANNSDDKIFIKNHHTAIIDRATWDRTQNELARRSVGAEMKRKHTHRYWCSGKIICGECGENFVARRNRKKDNEYTLWECRLRALHGKRKIDAKGIKKGCDMRTINNKSLLECVYFAVKKLSEGMEDIVDEIMEEINRGAENDDILVEAVKRNIHDTENKRIKMLDSYFSEIISFNEMESLKAEYDRQLGVLYRKIDDVEKRCNSVSEIQQNAEFLRDVIQNQAMYSKSVYGEVVDKILVYNEYIIVKPQYVDFAFKIKYSTHGYKEKYTTVIEEFTVVENN